MSYNNFIAEDLSKHQWKNRLVLIIAEGELQSTYQDQLKELKRDSNGILDRKILVYHIMPKKYKTGLMNKSDWKSSNKLFKEFYDSDDQFKVILIGLDGGIKLEQSEIINLDKLFSIIDRMPMRRQEIRNRK